MRSCWLTPVFSFIYKVAIDISFYTPLAVPILFDTDSPTQCSWTIGSF
ncbi:hypothetical protein RSAG8_12369, partial [Rhizoctonia solani AG-8 WAC10335]